MKFLSPLKTGLAAAVAALGALTAARADVVWRWAPGDAPFVAPDGYNTAVFNDNDGAVWKFQDVPADLDDPEGWEDLASNTDRYWGSSASAPHGSAKAVSPGPGFTQVYLDTGGPEGDDKTSSCALVFTAPFAGEFRIGGRAVLGQWGGAGPARIVVGKIQSNTFTPLADYEAPSWAGPGPDFGSYSELNSIALDAGDSIAFILTHEGFQGQRWWLHDPSGQNIPEPEANALTITGVKKPANP